jgi:hypothetical protein
MQCMYIEYKYIHNTEYIPQNNVKSVHIQT